MNKEQNMVNQLLGKGGGGGKASEEQKISQLIGKPLEDNKANLLIGKTEKKKKDIFDNNQEFEKIKQLIQQTDNNDFEQQLKKSLQQDDAELDMINKLKGGQSKEDRKNKRKEKIKKKEDKAKEIDNYDNLIKILKPDIKLTVDEEKGMEEKAKLLVNFQFENNENEVDKNLAKSFNRQTHNFMDEYKEFYESSTKKDSHGQPQLKEQNKQVLLPYFKALFDLSCGNSKYRDPKFVAGNQCLVGDNKDHKLDKWISGQRACNKFLRFDSIFGQGKYQLFEDSIDPNDINQGQIGNCYFMASISSLAETPGRILKLFVTRKNNIYGCYCINACQNGLWRQIIVDDYIPCLQKSNKPAFAFNSSNETWVMLLEKAWAKMYGGYCNIVGGFGREVFLEMTGAPCATFDIKHSRLFEAIMQGTKTLWPMVTASQTGAGNHDVKSDRGIANCHLYTLLSGHEINYQGKKCQLVRLRNPWGSGEWKGSFGDKWSGWTPELKKQLGWKDEDDGVFYMEFKDFIQEFRDVEICQYFDKFKSTCLQTTSQYYKPKYIQITITKPGAYYFMVIQQSYRNFKHIPNYWYSMVHLKLYEYNHGKAKKAKFSPSPSSQPNIDTWIFCKHLDAGTYALEIVAGWRGQKETSFVAKTYGADFTQLENISNNQIVINK